MFKGLWNWAAKRWGKPQLNIQELLEDDSAAIVAEDVAEKTATSAQKLRISNMAARRKLMAMEARVLGRK